MTRAVPRISIDDALSDPELLGAALGDLESWSTWRVILKAAFAEPLDADELALFKTLSGGREVPAEQVSELWVVAGRRGGKTRAAGAVCVHLAAFNQHKLAPGETATVLSLAASKQQAKATRDYAAGFLTSSAILSQLLDGEPTSEEIRLKGNIAISTHSANFRTVRSRTLIGCVFDETAFWRDADTSANPDVEIYSAILPALATTGGMLIGISSPYRRAGLLFKKYQAAFGKNDPNVLVIKATSLQLNPTIDPGAIDRAREMDPEAARSEWDAEFRNDLSDFLTRVAVDACIDDGIHERAPDLSKSYVGFCDPSGGSSDSMTLAIAHQEGLTDILDAVREIKPPFSPEGVVAEFATLLKNYRISSVEGDGYAAEWVVSQFRNCGIWYNRSEKSKSEIYLEALPAINSHGFRLLDLEVLTNQLVSLERRTSRSGKDSVNHPPGAHDDLANAALGALVRSASGKAFAGSSMTREEREAQYFEQYGQKMHQLGADPLGGF
jgi:hypothetical protein